MDKEKTDKIDKMKVNSPLGQELGDFPEPEERPTEVFGVSAVGDAIELEEPISREFPVPELPSVILEEFSSADGIPIEASSEIRIQTVKDDLPPVSSPSAKKEQSLPERQSSDQTPAPKNSAIALVAILLAVLVILSLVFAMR